MHEKKVSVSRYCETLGLPLTHSQRIAVGSAASKMQARAGEEPTYTVVERSPIRLDGNYATRVGKNKTRAFPISTLTRAVFTLKDIHKVFA